MIRFLVVPMLIGISAFLLIFYLVPMLFSESDFVAFFAQLLLDASNALFASMPPLVADAIANLNLLSVALAIAVLLTLAIQIILLVGRACGIVARAVVAIFRRRPKQTEATALPSLDFEAGRSESRPGNKILGGGFDSLEPD